MKINLHKTYYTLAAIDVITIMITLFLAFSIYQIYDKAYEVNEQWMNRSSQYDKLTDLAILANAPGNDVFFSRDVNLEKKRLNKLNGKIIALQRLLINDAKTHLINHPEVIDRLNNFSKHFNNANQLTNKIFLNIKSNKLAVAGQIMASMDTVFHSALLELSKLREEVRNIQSSQLKSYHEKAKSIFYKELYVAGLILCLVGFILYFGKKIKASVEILLNDIKLKNQKLAENEEKLKSVLDSISESVILIDEQGIIEYINPGAESLFQYSQKELTGKNINLLVPLPDNHKHESYIKNFLKSDMFDQSNISDKNRAIEGLKKNGDTFPLDINISTLALENKVMFVGVLRDNTEKNKSTFYLSSIAKIQELYINGAKQDKVFDTILEFILKYTDSDYGFIGGIFTDNQQEAPYLKTYAITNIAWDQQTNDFYNKNKPEGLEFKNLNTLFGHTIKTGEIVLCNDPKNDPRAGGLPEGHPQMSSYLGMPILGSSGLIAMYGIANRKEGYDEKIIQELKTITAVITSIIEASCSLSTIEKMATQDALTGAYNRFYFKTYVDNMLRKRNAQNKVNKFSIMMIDFNKFKHINDYYGHEYGDFLLKEFVKRVEKEIKSEDMLARLGGDEFVVLTDNINEFTDAGKVADRIVTSSQAPYLYNKKTISCPVSIGVACYPISGESVDELLRHADLALYRAKDSDKGYCFFSEQLQVKYLERQNLEREIVIAFEKREFYIVLQPKVNIISEQIVGCEALIRWKHPIHGDYAPIHFIGSIESMGLADKLNIYVIEEAIKQLKCLTIENELSVSINISPYTYKLEENIRTVLDIISKSTLCENIKFDFEITETSFMSDDVNLKKGSEIDLLLSEFNIGLSLDDFGVQHSSINRLFECNFSTIKIDMSFVQKLDTAEGELAKVIIEAVMYIARGLNIKVVAEGAETLEQVDALKSLRCQIVQGYYFYKPLAVDEFIREIIRHEQRA